MDMKKETEATVLNASSNLDEKVSHNLQPENISIVKAKIDHALTMIRKENSPRAEINTMLTERKFDLDSLLPKLKYMRYFNRYGYRNPSSKVQKLQEASVNCGRSPSVTIKCANIKRLCHQMNRCNNSMEERRILKEIQRLEENPIPEDVMKNRQPWEWSYWGLETATNPKGVLRQRIKEALKELESSSALARERIAKEQNLEKRVEKAKNDITSYRATLGKINKKKAELYEYIVRLEKKLEKIGHFEATITP